MTFWHAFAENFHMLGGDVEGSWWSASRNCPSCSLVIVWIIRAQADQRPHPIERPLPGGWHVTLIRPKHPGRVPISPEVPPEFTEDYLDACNVIADSPRASAALSRECLQHILREKAEVKHPDNLAKAIQEVIDDPTVPSDLRDSLDIIRNIGNFSVHPSKSLRTGEIVDVEPGEAEWCLEVIEMLFDFYFVRPADIRRRREDLKKKLAEMGKPPVKVSVLTALGLAKLG